MVRNASRKLKFGVQSRFYPISTVGFRTFFPENFGQPYCAAIGPFTLTPTHFKPYHNMTVQGKKVFLKQPFLLTHRVRPKNNFSGLIKLRTSLEIHDF